MSKSVYCYLRISDKKQSLDRQKLKFKKFLKQHRLEKDNLLWFEETASRRVHYQKRKLGGILEKIKEGDVFIADEISRIGYNSLEIMTVLNALMEKKCQVFIISQGYEFKDDIQSAVFAFAFSLASRIERDLISSRTKDGLEAAKARGKILGRPKGSKSANKKLTPHLEDIRNLHEKGVAKAALARIYGVSRNTVRDFIKEHFEA